MQALPSRLTDRFRATLVGGIVGDALGAPFEGHHNVVAQAELDRACRALDALSHTDDTVMTLALAESVLFCGGVDQDHLARAFVAAWERAPQRGYGAGAASLLARLAAGGRWDELAPEQFGGAGSFGNGAAMRVAPLALLGSGDLAEVAEMARRSAVVTHTHPIAVEAAAVQAAAVALAFGEPPLDRAAFLGDLVAIARDPQVRAALRLIDDLDADASPGEVAALVGTGVAAHEAVPAAIASFVLHSYSFADCVRFAISLGGDTDTIASMAGAIAGAHLGSASIPVAWVVRAEGTGKARELADRFATRLRET